MSAYKKQTHQKGSNTSYKNGLQSIRDYDQAGSYKKFD